MTCWNNALSLYVDLITGVEKIIAIDVLRRKVSSEVLHVCRYLWRRPRFAEALGAEPVLLCFKHIVEQRHQYEHIKEKKLLCNLLTGMTGSGLGC